MESNRRRFPRLDIDHPAEVEFEHECFADCRILNFSLGGLFLQCDDLTSHEQIKQGYYQTPPRPQALIKINQSGHSTQVEIVYVSQAGLGVAFIHPEQALFSYLSDYQERIIGEKVATTTEWTAINKSTTKAIIDRLWNETARYLERHFHKFISKAGEDLIRTSDQTQLTGSHADLFFAITTLKQYEVQLHDTFISAVKSDLFMLMEGRSTARSEEKTSATELALVEKEEFDEWMMLNTIAHRLETRLAGPLYKLNLFLSHLLKRPINGEANPLSPISLLLKVQDSINEYNLAATALQITFQAFTDTVLNDLLRLYGGLEALFKEEGIGPEISNSLNPTDSIVTDGRSEAIVHPMQTLENLSTLLGAGKSVDAGQTSLNQPMLSASREQIFDSIESIPLHTGSSILNQLEKYLSQTGEGPLSLDPNTRAVIGTSEEVVSAVQQDDLLSMGVNELVRRFEIPIIKEIIRDPAILENAEHPGRRFLEAVEGLAPFCTDRSSTISNGRDLPRVLAQIISNIDQGSRTDIVEATAQLEELRDQQKEQFEHNRILAIESCKRNGKLRQAQKFVSISLQDMLLNKSISIALDRLFHYGWGGLLIHTIMLKDHKSNEWKAYLRVVEILEKIFRIDIKSSLLSQKSATELLLVIRKGFADYPVHPEGAQAFMEELQTALIQGGEIAQKYIDNRITIDQEYLHNLFLGQTFSVAESTNKIEVEKKWLQLVNRIEQGEWIVQRHEEGQARLINMAWKNPEIDQYLLLDGNGVKVLETDLIHLASKFQSNDYALLEDGEFHLVDRAVKRILKDSFETVQHKVSYDELTGLMNRRGFERVLNELLHEDINNNASHTLIMLDVDQFGLVNDICGFDGGDKLLQSITNILRSYLPGDGKLARVGDDEFGVLIPQSSLDQGYQLAEINRLAIDELKYSWNDQLIPVSASLGIVEISNSSISSADLLKAASSACNIAKQGGRNCTRIYRSTDKAFVEHNKLIKTAAGIEHTLENNRIKLMAQLIEPLQDSGESSHYEVLLRVIGEDDKLQSPFHFIQAAEQYELMRAVDRWVVNKFFQLVHSQIDKITEIGGFSINLSSQTIADTEFKDHLIKQIVSSPIPNEKLGFEITETVMLKDISDAVSFIEEIRELGCGFYLDDFGSGYASFSYLKDLPVDYVKIDGVFIKDLQTDHTSKAMVTSVTEITHFMGRKVVAEYVEDVETADILKKIGVDFIQGYHVGRPAPLEDLLNFKSNTEVIAISDSMPVLRSISSS